MSSGHLSVVPPYVEPRRRSLPSDVTTAVRWICFLVFLASFLLALPVQHPKDAQLGDLLGDIHAGRASSVAIHQPGGEQTSASENLSVRWKTNQFSWHEAKLNIRFDELTAKLTEAGRESGHPVAVGTYSTHKILYFNLADAGVWGPLSIVAGFLWVATFIGMLVTRDHPYATRWAWFWLFILGGVGPLLILWKEPVPLRLKFWRRDDDYRWTQAPLSGGTGFVYAIGWTILIVVAAEAFGWLGSR